MKTTVDWLKFRTHKSPFEAFEAIRAAFGTVGELLALGDPSKGKDGWLYRRSILLAGEQTIGQIDYGGDSQREWIRVDVPGTGCGVTKFESFDCLSSSNKWTSHD